jgi:ribonuclease BN (tRNA processing enzyme)
LGTGAIYSAFNSASTLINDDMIVDVPNGIFKYLLKTNHDVKKIDKILITHFHGDHTADIPFLLMYLYKNQKLTRKMKIIGPIGIEAMVKNLFDAYNYNAIKKIDEYIDFIELEANKNYDIDKYNIQTYLVKHNENITAYGYIVDNILGFTGDSSICEAVEKIVSSAKLTIADCSNVLEAKAHMGIDNIEYLANKYNNKIITTHIKDETREELKKVDNKNILVKEDGFKIQI